MIQGNSSLGLELTEDEAFALLAMCLTSPQRIDKTTESALKKLAAYCSDPQLTADQEKVKLFEYSQSAS